MTQQTATSVRHQYTTSLLKGGALLSEMRTLVQLWREDSDVDAIRHEIQQNNLLGKASRSRVRDILDQVFIPRYVRGNPPDTWRYLRIFEDAGTRNEVLRPLYYFYAARAEPLLGDFVREALFERYDAGFTDVATQHALQFISDAEDDGRIASPWSESSRLRVGRAILAALRDFGLLSGKVNKHITPFHLSPPAFAHIAFVIADEQPGEQALYHPDWRLFLLKTNQVERLFIEAEQTGLLRYTAAGTIVRIEFPEEDLHAYSRFLAARAY